MAITVEVALATVALIVTSVVFASYFLAEARAARARVATRREVDGFKEKMKIQGQDWPREHAVAESLSEPTGAAIIPQMEPAREVLIRTSSGSGSSTPFQLVSRKLATSLERLPSRYTPPELSAVVDTFRGASDAIRPFKLDWAELLSESAVALDQFRRSQAFRALFQTSEPLKARGVASYLDGYLEKLVKDVRHWLAEKNETKSNEALYELNQRMLNLDDFATQWRRFLALAARGIRAERVPKGYYNERKHTVTSIWDAEQNKEFSWLPWFGISEESDLLDELAAWVVEVFRDLKWEFDYVCALSNTADPLATLLMVKSRVPMIAIDNDTFKFVPAPPPPGKRVLLVDTVLRTGKHFQGGWKLIEAAEAKPSGGFFLACNDMLTPEEDKQKRDFEPLPEPRLYLYRLSELYQAWAQNVER